MIRYIAGGEERTYRRSESGVEWPEHSLEIPGADQFEAALAAVWTGQRYLVAVGDVIGASTDGLEWSNVHQSGGFIRGMGFAGDVVVAVGTLGTVERSTDGGLTWQTVTQFTTLTLDDVAHGNGTWVIVGQWGTVWTSPDGLSWIERSSGVPQEPSAGGANLHAVHRNDTHFVAVSRNGYAARSSDGISWTVSDLGGAGSTSNEAYAVTYADGLWVVWARFYTAHSSDGVAWTMVEQDWRQFAVGHDGQRFWSVGQGVLHSVDGAEWTLIEATDFGEWMWSLAMLPVLSRADLDLDGRFRSQHVRFD